MTKREDRVMREGVHNGEVSEADIDNIYDLRSVLRRESFGPAQEWLAERPIGSLRDCKVHLDKRSTKILAIITLTDPDNLGTM